MLSEQKTFLVENKEKKNDERKESRLFPKLNSKKNNFLPFSAELFHERGGYKNYKYMYFDLDYDEFMKAKKLGKRFDLEKHLCENLSAEDPPEALKRKKYINYSKKKLEKEFNFLKRTLSDERDGRTISLNKENKNAISKGKLLYNEGKPIKISSQIMIKDRGNDIGGMKKYERDNILKINDAEDTDERGAEDSNELFNNNLEEGKENLEETRLISIDFLTDKPEKVRPLILPILERKSSLFKVQNKRKGDKNTKKNGLERMEKESLFGKIKLLTEATRKKGSPSVKLHRKKNEECSIVGNIGRSRRGDGDERVEIELNNLKIAEIFNKFKKLKGIPLGEGKKGRVSKRNLEEFLELCVVNEETGNKPFISFLEK
jgi:hypothetical protein